MTTTVIDIKDGQLAPRSEESLVHVGMGQMEVRGVELRPIDRLLAPDGRPTKQVEVHLRAVPANGTPTTRITPLRQLMLFLRYAQADFERFDLIFGTSPEVRTVFILDGVHVAALFSVVKL